MPSALFHQTLSRWMEPDINKVTEEEVVLFKEVDGLIEILIWLSKSFSCLLVMITSRFSSNLCDGFII
jgi:hypothetical protein